MVPPRYKFQPIVEEWFLDHAVIVEEWILEHAE
jgi:hypothetical protein